MDSEYKLELERCPFCGEEAVVEGLREGEHMANCPECGAEINLAKLRDRQARGVINGNGDNR